MIYDMSKKNTNNVSNKEKNSVRSIKTLGNTLICESVKEITKNNTLYNAVISDNIRVDCYDPKNQIAVDYLPEQFFKYVPGSLFNNSIEEYYNRISNQERKKDILTKEGIIYIEVPYKTDLCFNNTCTENTSPYIRKERLTKHIQNELRRERI